MNGYDVINTRVPGFLPVPVNYLEQTDIDDLLKKKNQAIQNQDLDALTNLYGAGNIGSEALLGLGSSGQGGWQTQRLGQQQITSNRKRVQDLVKLDPTNPLALLITLLGAGEERELRDDLNALRGKDKKRQQQVAKVKAFEKSLKLGKNENAFASIVEREFKGDVVAAMNAPNIRELISQEKNRPVPLDWEDQHKLRTYVEEASNKLRLIEEGFDIAKPRQIAHLKSFIHMGNSLLDGSLQMNSKDFGVMSAMGEGFSKGYDPDGSKIGLGNAIRGGVSQKQFNESVMVNARTILNPKQLEIAENVYKHIQDGTATEKHMGTWRGLKQLHLKSIVDSKQKPRKVPEQKTLTSIVTDKLEEGVGTVKDAVNFFWLNPDKSSMAKSMLAGDDFHFEGKDDEKTHAGYKNMLNGVEHDVMINDKNGTYIADYGGKLVIGYIKDWERGQVRSKRPEGDKRILGTPVNKLDPGTRGFDWSIALDASQRLPSLEALTEEEIENITNSSVNEAEEKTKVHVLSSTFAQNPSYSYGNPNNLEEVEEGKKVPKFSVGKIYKIHEDASNNVLENIKNLKEQNKNNPDKLEALNKLENVLVNDPSNSDDPFGIYALLEKIESSDSYKDFLTGEGKPLEYQDDPKHITRKMYKLGGKVSDLLDVFSVEDLNELVSGYKDFRKRAGWGYSGEIEGKMIGAWFTIQNEAVKILQAPGFSGKARAIGGALKKSFDWLDDRDSGDEEPVPNDIPEGAFVEMPEEYGDFMKTIIIVETGGQNSIGNKTEVLTDGRGKPVLRDGKEVLVYSKDKDGNKIPVSWGVGQLTIETALATPYGKAWMEKNSGKLGKTKEERRASKIKFLMTPAHNYKMAKQYESLLRKRFKENAYAKEFDPIDMNLLVATAYNYRGESMLKILNKTKPKSFSHLLKKWRFPKETKVHIGRIARKMLERGRYYGN